MTQPIDHRNLPALVLTIVTQVFLFVLATVLFCNTFNVDNLLYYAERYYSDSPIIFRVLQIFTYFELTLSAGALIFAGIRLHSPTWNGAIIAQITAIANTFLVLFLWGFNAFAIAVGTMYDVKFQKSPLALAAALVLTTILTAGMLSGVMRNHKQAAAPSE